MTATIISKDACDLGEGVFVNNESGIAYWLDINESKIFAYDIEKRILIFDLVLHHNPSVILEEVSKSLIYLDRRGVKLLDLESYEVRTIAEYPLADSNNMRGNDGVKLRDGTYMFGTMYDDPRKGLGTIYSLRSDGEITSYELGIRIRIHLLNYRICYSCPTRRRA